MDYNDYYRNTTNHDEGVQEQKNPNQLEPQKAIKGYLFIFVMVALIVGLFVLNEKLDKDEVKDSNSNSNVVSNQ